MPAENVIVNLEIRLRRVAGPALTREEVREMVLEDIDSGVYDPWFDESHYEVMSAKLIERPVKDVRPAALTPIDKAARARSMARHPNTLARVNAAATKTRRKRTG